MKVIKPLKLGLLTRVFEHGREPFFVVTVFACFPFDEPRALYSEQALWTMMFEEHGIGSALDTGLPKPRGEFLVDGHAYAPGGEAKPAVSVEVKIANLQKTLWVAGDRRWEALGMSMPEPFVSMPVDWQHAYGGAGFAKNPIGKGATPVPTSDGKKIHELPNVEYPNARIKSANDKPTPATFRAIDYTWPQRFEKLGTYDKKWLADEFPGFARDIDFAAFSTAPEDQRLEGFFAGDESFTIVNMHPTEARIESKLPALTARAFATIEEKGEQVFREISMRADTVHFIPHRKMAIVMFRGLTPIREDDAHDVKNLLLAAERMGEQRPVEHYKEVLAARLDRQRGGLLALRDQDLLPDLVKFAGDEPYLNEMHAKLEREGLVEDNMHRRALRSHAERVAKVKELGLDPAGLMGPPPEKIEKTKVDVTNLAEVVATAEREADIEEKKLEEEKRSSEEKARALCEANGLDYDEVVKKAADEGGGPPQFSADEELAKVRAAVDSAREEGVPMPGLEAMMADPRFERRLRDNEKTLKDLYRKFVHHFPAVTDADDVLARTRGEFFVSALAENGEVRDRDFSGADLRKVDLSKKNLRYAFLEKSLLDEANLEGADLEGAVLGRARLRGTKLTGARLVSTNFGHADLDGANLDGADLTQATLDGARLHRASLVGAKLMGTSFDESRLDDPPTEGADVDAKNEAADLSKAVIDTCIFKNVHFGRARLRGAHFESTVFFECDVTGTSFSGASFKKTAFVGAKGVGIDFRTARADNVRFVSQSVLDRGQFAGASLKGANFRATSLRGADFTGADLEGADLSEADLEGANFSGANLRDARFVRSNLTGASLASANLLNGILQKAKVNGATFKGANLFRADLAYVVGDDATTFEGAYVDQVRFLRRPT